MYELYCLRMLRVGDPAFACWDSSWLVLAAGYCRFVVAAPEQKPEQAAAAAEGAVQDEKARPRRQGQWIRIPLPIDNSVVLLVKQSIERTLGSVHDERPVFVLEFIAPEGAADAGQGTQFEDAHKLARFLTSDELNGASTVAYVPKALKGHAVMVAMACEQIIMSPTATMGDAGADEKVINNTMLAAYEEIARSRRTVPARDCPGHARQGPAGAQGENRGRRAIRRPRPVAGDHPAAPHPRPGNDQAAGRGRGSSPASRPATGESSSSWPTTVAT